MGQVLLLTFNMSLGIELRDLLKLRAISCEIVTNGNKGIELCFARPFDVVMICEDAGGGGIDQIATQVKRALPHTRMILVASKETPRLSLHSQSPERADVYHYSTHPSAREISEILIGLIDQLVPQPVKEETLSSQNIGEAFEALFADLEAPHTGGREIKETESSLPELQHFEVAPAKEVRLSKEGKESSTETGQVAQRGRGEENREEIKKLLREKQKRLQELEKELEAARRNLSELEEASRRGSEQGEDLRKREVALQVMLKDMEEQRKALLERHQGDMADLQKKYKEKIDQLVISEKRLQQCQEKFGVLREQVRVDLQQIKLREKEIENRLEIVKRDSQTLLRAKDQKVLELKRRVDMLEFDIEHLQGKLAESHQIVDQWKERMGKASKAINLALTLLDTQEREEVEELAGEIGEADQEIARRDKE